MPRSSTASSTSGSTSPPSQAVASIASSAATLHRKQPLSHHESRGRCPLDRTPPSCQSRLVSPLSSTTQPPHGQRNHHGHRSSLRPPRDHCGYRATIMAIRGYLRPNATTYSQTRPVLRPRVRIHNYRHQPRNLRISEGFRLRRCRRGGVPSPQFMVVRGLRIANQHAQFLVRRVIGVGICIQSNRTIGI